MSSSAFIRHKRKERDSDKSWFCRLGQHRAHANEIVVKYEGHRGLCRYCVGRQCQRHNRDTIHLPSYWTRDWPKDAVGVIGERRTWAEPMR